VFRISLLGELLRFGVPIVPSNVAWWVFGLSDRIVLGRLGTLQDVGLYSVANSATSGMSLLAGSLMQGWSPHAVSLYEEQEQEAARLYGRMLTYIIVGFGVLAVTVTAFGQELLSILATSKFQDAATAIGPLALSQVAAASLQITGAGMSLKKKTSYLAVFAWGAAVLNVVLNLALVPRFGMLASAWATFAAFAFLTGAYFLASQRLWRVAIERRKTLIAVVVTTAFTVAVPLLPDLSLLPGLAMKAAYVLTCVAALILLGAVDRREVAVIGGIVRGILPSRSGTAAG
jgi:O-antigen/teichoic acid export membrane protein